MQILLVLSALAASVVITGVDDLASTFDKLKAAESSGDADQVEQLAGKVSAIAREVAKSTPPETDADTWAQTVAYARQVDLYAEYALYTTALKSPPATTVRLISALERQNAKSKYLDLAYGRYFVALTQTGSTAKIPSIAEKALVNFPTNDDLLVVLTDAAMNGKQTDRALQYAERLIASLNARDAREGVSAAEWQRKRSASLGRARWIAGVMHSEKAQYYEADRDLRAALGLIKGNETMTASALFYLGVANYQLGAMARNRAQVLEAAKFSEEASKYKGPLSEQAWRNAQVMKAEAAKVR